jgi:hypothetical protein
VDHGWKLAEFEDEETVGANRIEPNIFADQHYLKETHSELPAMKIGTGNVSQRLFRVDRSFGADAANKNI